MSEVIDFIVNFFSVIRNILIALLGFGMVVIVHEFGHFIVAKAVGIKVEAFSLFMPPTFFGLRRTKRGWKLRILPAFFKKGDEEEGPLKLTFGSGGKDSDTEYRIGLFPFGGYVKLLGQEDIGPVKTNDDPRSFGNKPVSARIPVIAAGVIFNAISAAIIFIIVFLVGIQMPPAIVGGVLPDSPAAKAGLKSGDVIKRIAGHSIDIDFSYIILEGALSGKGEPVPITVEHENGDIETVSLIAEELPGSIMKEFGILQPLSLEIAQVQEPELLFERTGAKPGDTITAINNVPVKTYWALADLIKDMLLPNIRLTLERSKDNKTEEIHTEIPLEWQAGPYNIESESELNHIHSMVPRMVIAAVSDETGNADKIKVGDIIVAIGEIENPTYLEMRQLTEASVNQELKMTILRSNAEDIEEELTVSVIPKLPVGSNRPVIGLNPVLDASHPIVANTISANNGPEKLNIPRGAQITAIDGIEVASFYDIAEQIKSTTGRDVVVDYIKDKQTGSLSVNFSAEPNYFDIDITLAESLPLKELRHTYKATGIINALGMGYRRTIMFITQAYVTLKRLVTGLLSPKHLMGPLGIVTTSYQVVAQEPLVYYAYFLGLISASIAVLNFVPIMPFDGGLIVLMLIEKIKGSAISEKTMEIMAYAGWALILTLVIFVTYNDILRIFSG